MHEEAQHRSTHLPGLIVTLHAKWIFLDWDHVITLCNGISQVQIDAAVLEIQLEAQLIASVACTDSL